MSAFCASALVYRLALPLCPQRRASLQNPEILNDLWQLNGQDDPEGKLREVINSVAKNKDGSQEELDEPEESLTGNEPLLGNWLSLGFSSY